MTARSIAAQPWRTVAGVATVWALVASCGELAGPDSPPTGHIMFYPVFESTAASLVPVERLLVTLMRSDSVTIAAADTIDLVAGQDSIDLGIEVILLQSAEQFFLDLKLIDAAGDTVFRGSSIVTASPTGETGEVQQIPLSYTGTGSAAVSVQVTTPVAKVFFGDTVQIGAVALDSVGEPIPGTPVRFSSLTPSAGSFSDDESGLFIAGSVRGDALVEARLLTGPADTGSVSVQSPPAAVGITSGNSQTGPIGAPLPSPLAVTVNGTDSLGVEGVLVVFAAVGNGSVSVDSVLTDSLGVAQAVWTLGTTPGAQQATATVPAISASVTFDATATAVLFKWTNAGGGNWSDPTNWDVGVVPGTGDDVIIDLDGTYGVNLDVSASVNTLTLGAASGSQTLVVASNTLTMAGTSTVGANGVLALSGATAMLTGAGTLSVSGAFIWSQGTVGAGGDIQIETTGTLSLAGGSMLLRGGRQLNNAGSVVWSAGTLDAGDDVVVTNQVGGTFDIQGSVSFDHTPGAAPSMTSLAPGGSASAPQQVAASFVNLGTLTGTVAAFAAINVAFINTGTVDLQAGTLDFLGGGTSSGTFTTAGGTSLRFGAGTFAFDATSSISGTGQIFFVGGTTVINGGFTNLAPGVTVLSAGTVEFNGTTSVNSLFVSGGIFGGTGLVSIDGAIDWSAGTMTGTGTTKVLSSGTLTLSGSAKTLIGGRILDNAGTGIWTGGDIDAGDGSAVINQSGGTFTITASVALNHSQGGAVPTFTSSGIVDVQPSSGVVVFQSTFNNNSSITVTKGTLSLTGGGAGAGSFTVPTGATLLFGGGAHTLATLTNDGTVDVQAGTAKVTGTYTQTSGVLQGAGVFDLPNGLATSAIVNMTGTLVVGSGLSVSNYSVGTTEFAGTGPQSIPSLGYTNVVVTGTAFFGAGTTISGNLTVTGGSLDVGLQAVVVTGAFGTTAGGVLKMIDGRGSLDVGGDVIIDGGSTAGKLTAGTLNVAGNFTQSGDPASFAPAAAFVVSFGTGGCTAATISFADPVNSNFGRLNLSNRAVSFASAALVAGDVTGTGDITETSGPHTVTVTGNVNITSSPCAQQITLGTLKITGNLTVNTAVTLTTLEIGGVLALGTGSYSVTNTVFTAATAPQIMPMAFSPYNNVEVRPSNALDTVRIDGSMTIAGTLTVSGTGVFALPSALTDTVTVTGGDVTVKDNGILDVGGIGTVLNVSNGGNVIVSGNAEFYIGLAGGVNVTGNFSTQDLGVLEMVNIGDVLDVDGDVTFGGGSTAGELIAGTLVIGGNFTQSGDPASFAPTGSFQTTFDGSVLQTVSFANPGATSSRFQNLAITNSSGSVDLSTNAQVNGNLTVTSSILTGTGTLTVVGNVTVASTLSMTGLAVGGVLSVTGTYGVTNTEFTGSAQIIPNLTYTNVMVTGTAQFALFGSHTVAGSVVVSGNGNLTVDTTNVIVNGNFSVQDLGLLTMSDFSSFLQVDGSVLFDGTDNNPTLQGGQLHVGGNFTQLATNSPVSFHSAGVDVYLFGTGAQTVSFATPGIGIGVELSHFRSLFITKSTGTVTLASDVFATGNLGSGVSFSPTIVGNGNKLLVGGFDVDDLALDRVLLEYKVDPLTIPANGFFTAFDNVNFTNYLTSDTQFTIIHPGGVSPFTLNNITFGTTPTTGLYMDVTDNAVDANLLTIQMASPTPGTPTTFVSTGGSASVVWPWP